MLLLDRHGRWVLVTVAVKPNLVSCVANHGAFFGKGFERVSGYVPCGLDVVFSEELEKAPDPNGASEKTARYVGRRVLAAITTKPAGHGVNVDRDAAEGF